jgi:hypothetical protein
MNNTPTQTQSLAGDYVSKSPVRGVFNPRRRTPRTTRTEPVTIRATDPPTASQKPSAPAGGPRPRPRRRWSVAKLIARAVTAPPPTA